MGAIHRGGPADTRGEILALLCSANRTARELAGELGISSTAVHGHLRRLESDGLVRYRPVRGAIGKPAHEYSLTEEGEARLSGAYLPLLQALLDVLEEEMPAAAAEDVFRRVGHRLARPAVSRSGSLAQRVASAADRLRGLGAVVRIEEGEEETRIRCLCCAIGAVVREHPLACKAMAAMLSESLGVPVREECDRRERPRCRFEVGAGT